MLEPVNPQLSINESAFAVAHKAILKQSVQRQNDKKKNLLSEARTISNMKKKAPVSAIRVTEQKKLLDHLEFWRGSECEFSPSSLSQLFEDIKSNERFKQYRGTIGVKNLLARDEPPIQQVLNADIVPKMIEFLQLDEEPQLQSEAVWLLANAAGGTTETTQCIVDKGAIFWLIRTLSSRSQEVREKSSWALGNIAADSPGLRDRLIASGALPPLLKVVEDPEVTQKVIKEGTYAISTLCRGRPLPPVEKVESAIPTLCKVIKSQTDKEVLTDAAWALSYLTRIEATARMVVDCPNTILALISLLSGQHLQIQITTPCLRILGNICTGNEDETDAVINHPKFFEKLWNLIEYKKKTVRMEIMWILSNIAGGTDKQRDAIFKSFPFVDKLVSCIKTDITEVKREALHVAHNTLKQEIVSEFWLFWDAGLFPCYVSILKASSDTTILRLALEGIYHMLRVGKKMATESQSEQNMVLVELENTGIPNEFDTLQDHQDDNIYEIVTRIIRDFIPSIEIRSRREESEDDDDDYSEDEDYE